ncbi:MAG: hypothetical protein Tsb0015_09590 [Simkaniaceae bacterium]
MPNIDKDSKNIIIGACVGGIVGLGMASICYAAKHQKKGKSTLEIIGKTMTHIGEALEHPKSALSHACETLEDVEHTVEKHESKIVDILEWTAASIHLLKKLRGGK